MNKAEALYKYKNLAWVNDSNSESVCELPGSKSKKGNNRECRIGGTSKKPMI